MHMPSRAPQVQCVWLVGALLLGGPCRVPSSTLGSLKALLLLTAVPAAASGTAGYQCASNWQLPTPVENDRKGICLDDTTFQECAEKIPVTWPHTDAPIKNLRVFKAWDDDFQHPPEERFAAHSAIAEWAHLTGAQVMLGVQLTCDKEQNERQWGWTKELLQKLGPDSVMGVAIGNEMDLYELKDHKEFGITVECINELWGHGQGPNGSYFFRLFEAWVADLDSLPGFAEAKAGGRLVPITTVLSGLSMATDGSTPFVNGEPYGGFYNADENGNLMINDLLSELFSRFGERFVFSLNIYPYFDDGGNVLDIGCFDRCRQTVFTDLCFGNTTDEWGNLKCKFLGTAARFRRAVSTLTGNPDDPFWVTEFGWSYPVATTLKPPMHDCKDFTSQESFVTAYQGFLQWDVLVPGVEPPSHIFYFTIRDSENFGERESFGLVSSCAQTDCKMQCAGDNGDQCPEPYCWAKPESLGVLECQPEPPCQWPEWAAPIWDNLLLSAIIAGVLLFASLVGVLALLRQRCRGTSCREPGHYLPLDQ